MASERPVGDTQLFLVRVWQQGCEFRASVRAVDEREPRLFTAVAQLADFLAEAVAAAQPRIARPPAGRDEQGP
jgi:hypothetical protein